MRVRMDDPTLQVCGGSFEALDRHATLVRGALLLEGDGIIDYSIGDADFVNSACNIASAACTKATTGAVFATTPMLEHEVVHAARILDAEIELRSSPIEEGLATIFGGDRFDDIDPGLDPSIILRDDQLQSAREYHDAGQMIALLLRQDGVEAFRRFDLLAGTVGEEDAFSMVYGQSKQQFVDATSAEAHCKQSQWWTPLLECDGELIEADPATGSLVLTGNLACGHADVRGPRDETMWISRRFRLERPTSTLSYAVEMPEDATLEIVACGGGCPDRFAYIGTRYQVGSVVNGLPALDPGEYFLRMSRPVSEQDGYFEVVLQ